MAILFISGIHVNIKTLGRNMRGNGLAMPYAKLVDYTRQ
jgi:hypothetical protein